MKVFLLAIAAVHKMKIHQMDVSTAFLNGKIDTELYIKQPKGFIDEQFPHMACKLSKSLYGLKQAPLIWNSTINKFLESNGYSIENLIRDIQKKGCDFGLYEKITPRISNSVSILHTTMELNTYRYFYNFIRDKIIDNILKLSQIC